MNIVLGKTSCSHRLQSLRLPWQRAKSDSQLLEGAAAAAAVVVCCCFAWTNYRLCGLREAHGEHIDTR